MNKAHTIDRIVFEGDDLCLDCDGKAYRFRLAEISGKLAQATPAERAKFELSPSGYGIHWPLLDEDLSIDGLLGVKHTPKGLTQQLAV